MASLGVAPIFPIHGLIITIHTIIIPKILSRRGKTEGTALLLNKIVLFGHQFESFYNSCLQYTLAIPVLSSPSLVVSN